LKVANDDVSLVSQIAKQQALKEPTVMLALATPSPQAYQNITNKNL